MPDSSVSGSDLGSIAAIVVSITTGILGLCTTLVVVFIKQAIRRESRMAKRIDDLETQFRNSLQTELRVATEVGKKNVDALKTVAEKIDDFRLTIEDLKAMFKLVLATAKSVSNSEG